MSEMSQSQQPAGGDADPDPSADVVPDSASSGGDTAEAGGSGSEADADDLTSADIASPGSGSDPIPSGGSGGASDPMPDIAGTS